MSEQKNVQNATGGHVGLLPLNKLLFFILNFVLSKFMSLQAKTIFLLVLILQ